jgi:hypothetical protein
MLFLQPEARSLKPSSRLLLTALLWGVAVIPAHTQTDLDALMKQVLEQRDENWRKLRQYVLDERESIDVRGPGRVPIWGERREYTWYIRDGFFVRSPLRVNGVDIADGDRRKYEADYLKRQKEREERQARQGGPATVVPSPDDATPETLSDGLLKQTRRPEFISSAYFLRFRFEEGKYALVGRETIDGRETLRIEYYPARLFRGTDRRRSRNGTTEKENANARAYDEAFRRLMNKIALVTLWVEPKAYQIVKYTFDNIGFDFLPAQWLVHIDTLHAAMNMGQPFPDIWLPRDLELSLGATFAAGPLDVRYALEYRDYRQPDVTAKVKIR